MFSIPQFIIMLEIKIKLRAILLFLTLFTLTFTNIIKLDAPAHLDEKDPPLEDFIFNFTAVTQETQYKSDTTDDSGQWTEEYGNKNGAHFGEYISSSSFSKIQVKSGLYIDGFRFVFHNDTRSPFFGGVEGGKPYRWGLDEGDQIEKIVINFGNFLDGIQFFTTKGKKSPHFGGNGGKKAEIELNGKKIYGYKVYYSQYITSFLLYLK